MILISPCNKLCSPDHTTPLYFDSMLNVRVFGTDLSVVTLKTREPFTTLLFLFISYGKKYSQYIQTYSKCPSGASSYDQKNRIYL